jgi:hypothetical protein
MQTQYSSVLTTSNQAYCPRSSCEGPYYYYKAIDISVSSTGYYIIVSNNSMDTYGYLYTNTFDPTFSDAPSIAIDNDSGGNGQFRFLIQLQAMVSYILVVTTSEPNITGSFTITGIGLTSISFGPANISGKNSHYLTVFISSIEFVVYLNDKI